jgi:hypothetical protein
VFTVANRRCERVLTPPNRMGFDPHQVFATPHSAGRSFALFMLVVLNTLMDLKYRLSPEGRRDFRQLYGDPWFMVQCLLGHASRETTVDRCIWRPWRICSCGRCWQARLSRRQRRCPNWTWVEGRPEFIDRPQRVLRQFPPCRVQKCPRDSSTFGPAGDRIVDQRHDLTHLAISAAAMSFYACIA